MPPDDSDDVIIETLRCAFCFKDLDFLSISEREAHYEHHFTNGFDDGGTSEANPIPIASTSHQHPTSNSNSNKFNSGNQDYSTKKKRTWKWPKETDFFWYPQHTDPPPSSFTPGLIPLLRKGLLKGHSRGNLRRAVLCYEKAVHSHREVWDANWGCGYRNFLMACAALMSQVQQPLYFPLLDSPISPSIRNLQITIEAAWKEGFDLEGQAQLKKLVGTSKWIGTSDLWVAFTFRGIPASLVEFEFRNNPKGSQSVIDWVVNYFSPKETTPRPTNAFESLRLSPVTITDKMPIILQHDGHSRTIVGYEVDKNGATSLLAFDPAYRPPEEICAAAVAEFCQPQSRNEDPSANATSSTMASSSNLKRKRSVDLSLQENKVPRTGGSSFSSKGKAALSKALSPLKNGASSVGGKQEGKELDLWAASRKFRLELKNLSKKKHYQILYFPMTAPLTDYEKSQSKEVRCTKIS